MRAMKKGDLAFFYHSNCKVPGIAGIMEIVREHSIDGMYLRLINSNEGKNFFYIRERLSSNWFLFCYNLKRIRIWPGTPLLWSQIQPRESQVGGCSRGVQAQIQGSDHAGWAQVVCETRRTAREYADDKAIAVERVCRKWWGVEVYHGFGRRGVRRKVNRLYVE